MPAKKSTKKPSAKQLAARRKFAAAAKARSKAAKAKKRNKTIITKPKRVIVINKLKNGSTVRRKIRNSYVDLVVRGTAKKTPQGWLVGKKTIPQGRGIATISSGYYLDKATGMIFAKRARNVSQGFYDASGVFHPIRSSADYDPATAGETGKKPRRTRSKKRKAAAKKASSTARHKAATKSRKKTTLRLASRALSRSVPLKAGSKVQRARNPRYEVVGVNAQGKEFDLAIHVDANKTKTLQWAKSHYPGYKKYQITLRDRQDYIGGTPKPKTRKRRNSAASDRREFAGRYTGDKDLYFPQGTPTGLSKLGKLVLIKTQSGSIVPVKGTVWLCRDTKGKLHLGTTNNAPLTDLPAGSLGEVKRLEYEESKPHLGHPNPTIWFHKMGEETGERPTLYSDGKGGLKFRGGRYRITSRGIEN